MNELDKYSGGGEVAPYSSPLQPLAPAPDTWGSNIDVLTPREIHSGSQVQSLFGETVGATEQQINLALGRIAGTYLSDMSQLNHPLQVIQAAITWFQASARKSPQREAKQHSYNMHDQAHDPLMMSFCNAMARAGASQAFISNSLWWLGQLNQHLNAQGSHEPPRKASSASREDSMSDAEWARLEAKSVVDKQRGQDELRNRWGHEFETRMRVVTTYYQNLPQRDREHFENALLPGDMAALNSPDVIEKLYFQALGGHSIPKGSGLQTEIQQIETLMRTNRRAYNRDEALQMRYRLLLEQRDGS